MRVITLTPKNKRMTVKGEEIMLPNFLGHLKEEKGATAVEYALLAALIAGVIVGAVALIGSALVPGFTTVSAVL
jgi:pilus assembly protein Flp/PilA